jgi:hypothetical protein
MYALPAVSSFSLRARVFVSARLPRPVRVSVSLCCTYLCIWNSCALGLQGLLVIRALRDVAAGEELTHTYVDVKLPTAQRQEELLYDQTQLVNSVAPAVFGV